MKRWMASVIPAAILIAGTATAGDGTARSEAAEDFSEVDLNKDGVVDRTEYTRRMSDMYFHADKDKNGSLNRAELVAIEEEMVFVPADANGDGELSMHEYVDERFDQFREIDVDSNGVLTEVETINAYEANWD